MSPSRSDSSAGSSTSTSTSTSTTTTTTTTPDFDAASSFGKSAVEFAQQAEKLSYRHPEDGETDSIAVEARFPAPCDPVIVTSDGNRLPAVSLEEAHKLNILKNELEASHEPLADIRQTSRDDAATEKAQGLAAENEQNENGTQKDSKGGGGSLRSSIPSSHTNPLFPPLPLYGPPSVFRDIQCRLFRFTSFFLSMAFLGVIVLGSLFTSIPTFFQYLWQTIQLKNPDADRPFYEEEMRRRQLRKEQEQKWRRRRQQRRPLVRERVDDKDAEASDDNLEDCAGEPDPIVCDVGYYARRVGLDVETYEVQTEDGFIIDLWHVYDPEEYTPLPEEERTHQGDQKHKFPVLLIHGLLQSSGAYCVNDDASLAFYLCKSGYDVWLGNNRCGFQPRHVLLPYADPRMWAWNIRQMGVFDLPALASRVLRQTGFAKLGLIAHSQGTTQTFVALAKEQRPELGERLTVFCALAPAAYAGPLIGKMYFKFMRVITPAMFRLLFGIHAFIPLMMTMHRVLGAGMFQFAPVYVSAESMRWWLGRECFAKHKCILATKEEWRAEEREDEERSVVEAARRRDGEVDFGGLGLVGVGVDGESDEEDEGGEGEGEREKVHKRKSKGSSAWYNHQAPPFALWVCGNDALVDGDKLLRRFERGREPHVDVVHSKVIEGYEHLDVIWAMDAVDQVFKEVREVLWKTCDVRDMCRVPVGCEDVEKWERPQRGGSDEPE
ncbi:Alpha/Beta hydrolase protein [Bombardia bombarda]|uniref:Alpha/Beta hydrolase protein n=1 Tax=Bombardia bombarda TaxID=252184 RepID=A0AA40BYH3_9PEZI|nr:Alpha/Beta hydrolase protein [Bombardia bombarda]